MLKVEVITVEKIVKTAEGAEVLLPGIEGQLGVRTGHLPLITPLKAGEVVIKQADGTEEVLAVFGGFAEIVGNTVRVMADSAELAEELDEKAVREAIARAEDRRKGASDQSTINEALVLLNANLARLKAIKRRPGSHR